MSTKTYYKGLRGNLCSIVDSSFQYSVGETFTADTDDDFHWLHFTPEIQAAISYGERIVEVEPVSRMNVYSEEVMNAKSIRIVRELSMQEILSLLVRKAEKRSFPKKRLLFYLRLLTGERTYPSTMRVNGVTNVPIVAASR